MERVKSAVEAVFALDIVVLLGWFACAITIMSVDCRGFLIVHTIVAGHFTGQTLVILDILSKLREIKWEQKWDGMGLRQTPTHPPKPSMAPVTWALISAVVLVVDVLLLYYDAKNFQELASDDQCRRVAIFQLSIESATVLCAGISLICFGVATHYIKQYHGERVRLFRESTNPSPINSYDVNDTGEFW